MLNSYFNLPEGTSCYIHILDSSVGPIWSQEKLEDLPGPFQGIEFSQYAGVYSKKTHPITSNYHSWAILFWLAMPYITNYFSLKKRWAVGECRGPGRAITWVHDGFRIPTKKHHLYKWFQKKNVWISESTMVSGGVEKLRGKGKFTDFRDSWCVGFPAILDYGQSTHHIKNQSHGASLVQPLL